MQGSGTVAVRLVVVAVAAADAGRQGLQSVFPIFTGIIKVTGTVLILHPVTQSNTCSYTKVPSACECVCGFESRDDGSVMMSR